LLSPRHAAAPWGRRRLAVSITCHLHINATIGFLWWQWRRRRRRKLPMRLLDRRLFVGICKRLVILFIAAGLRLRLGGIVTTQHVMLLPQVPWHVLCSTRLAATLPCSHGCVATWQRESAFQSCMRICHASTSDPSTTYARSSVEHALLYVVCSVRFHIWFNSFVKSQQNLD
jgi:hypothetical protein